MASVKRFSLITKCLAALLAMASFPYDTKGVPNNNKKSSIAFFQDQNVAKMEPPLGESGKQLTIDARKRPPQLSGTIFGVTIIRNYNIILSDINSRRL